MFETSTWSWLSAIKSLWRYGFSLVKMQGVVTDLMRKFSNIYKLQEQGEMFETVPDMLRSMGGEQFYNLTQISTRKYLKEEGLSQQLIDELVTAVMRINYGQSTELNAFTGKVYFETITPPPPPLPSPPETKLEVSCLQLNSMGNFRGVAHASFFKGTGGFNSKVNIQFPYV